MHPLTTEIIRLIIKLHSMNTTLTELECVLSSGIKAFCTTSASLQPHGSCALRWLNSISFQLALHSNLLSSADTLEDFQYLDFQQLP